MSTLEANSNRYFMNPLIRKLSKVDEQSQNHATYKGITAKTIYFLVMVVIGIGISFFLHNIASGGDVITVEGATTSALEVGALLLAGVFFIFTPMLAFIIRPIIPIMGTLYCLSTGYIMAFMADTFAEQYAGAVWIALILTLVIVFVMAILYSTGAVKVGHKFRAVVSILFFSTFAGGIAMFIGSFIPGLKDMVAFIQGNSILSILGSILFIIIASLFLLVDFDTIRHTVDNELPKKYEWVAAFGLVFTVIWLYLKVLDLILKTQRSSS